MVKLLSVISSATSAARKPCGSIPILDLPKKSSYFQLPHSQSIQAQIPRGKKQICCFCSVEHVCYPTLSGLWTIQCDISCGKVEFPETAVKYAKNEINK